MPPDDETRTILDSLAALVQTCDVLRQQLDRMSSERGVPIKNTVARVNKAREYLQSAREYWEYDVLRGNAKTTKAERGRQEMYELS